MSIWGKIVEDHAAHIPESAKPVEAKARVYNTATEKRCSKCGEIKPRSEFYPRRNHSPNAVSQMCKVCHVQYHSERRRAKK